eukprot:2527139-Prorocentrum_lima.AAC.1
MAGVTYGAAGVEDDAAANDEAVYPGCCACGALGEGCANRGGDSVVIGKDIKSGGVTASCICASGGS